MNGKTGEVESVLGRGRWIHILPTVFLMHTISFFDRVNLKSQARWQRAVWQSVFFMAGIKT
jgi:hypothetical protein